MSGCLVEQFLVRQVFFQRKGYHFRRIEDGHRSTVKSGDLIFNKGVVRAAQNDLIDLIIL